MARKWNIPLPQSHTVFTAGPPSPIRSAAALYEAEQQQTEERLPSQEPDEQVNAQQLQVQQTCKAAKLLQQQLDEEAVSVEQSRLLLDELERRIALCESAIGLEASSATDTLATSAASGSPAEYESSLVLALCRLQHQANAAMRGPLADIEGKYSELKVWLEGGHVSAARLLLTLRAKRDLVLQQEEQLLSVATQLRTLQGLEDVVNPPCLSELEDYKRRMRILEAQGNSLAVQTARLEEKVVNLAALYNTTMNMVSSVMEEWHVLLAKSGAANETERVPSSVQQQASEKAAE
ncbi:hypothetical protein cyc_04655 [Cyclospora cayetanensis]|uniref:Dynactin subunit n=1 Tax=Cyclospora cayetanensis TaxID=88456 RepID=A0A1D3CYT5_9EIME|nr:hypothetical protein cyc_04655 [Cyclospora cayetanensis]